jgi:hypothetical protein
LLLAAEGLGAAGALLSGGGLRGTEGDLVSKMVAAA